MPIGLPEFVENPEPRCPVILLCDTSGSMAGAPIDALNEGLATFKSEVHQDEIAALRVEVAIVTFGPVQLTQDFITIDNYHNRQFYLTEINCRRCDPDGRSN